MDVNNYVRETERQPNNSKNYKVLTKAPTITNSNLVNQTINRFKKEQLINESIASGLKTNLLEPHNSTYLQSSQRRKPRLHCGKLNKLSHI